MTILDRLNIEEPEEYSRLLVKVCTNCKIEKPLSAFPTHIGMVDNLDTRCDPCMKSQSKYRTALKKIVPVKPLTVCECCGRPFDNTKKGKPRLDHDHGYEEVVLSAFRGYICDRCNTGIGLLGDNIAGLINALTYLRAYEERKELPDSIMMEKLLEYRMKFHKNSPPPSQLTFEE